MEFILDKEDYEKFMVFSYIEGTLKQRISISDIEKRFSLSYFKATKLMEELMEDFTDLELDSFFLIEKRKKVYVYTKNGLDSINRLLWIYGRRSLSLAFLDYFLKNENATVEDFSYDYYISMSKSYKIRKNVNTFLDEYNLNFLESNQYSENQLRMFLSDIYYNIFKIYEEPFDNLLIAKTEKLIRDLKEIGLIQLLTNLDYVKLKFYLCITYLRNERGRFSSEQFLTIGQVKKEHMEKIEFLLESFLVNSNHIKSEVQMFINFLQINEFLTESTRVLSDMIRTNLDKLFEVTFFNKELCKYRSQIRKSFEPFFIELLYYNNKILDSQFYSDLSVFEENYSKIYKMCINIYSNQEVVNLIGCQSKNKKILLVTLLKLIDIIPTDMLLRPVRITVDFSIGKEYNTFIASTIKNLPFVNIVIDNSYSVQTDIYLSDCLTSQVESKYIIWNSPPTPKDWEIFGNLVSTIREQ
ncbi:hypothetical protein H8V64_001947 [Enterococcus faecalis]|nr:hypothetical protein [Enterococcus faecalis]